MASPSSSTANGSNSSSTSGSSSSALAPAAAATPQPPAGGASPAATTTSSSNRATADDADRLPALLKNDPARTGYDPGTAWWMNYFKILTGGVTAEGQFHYREDRTRANEARDVRRCEEMRDHLLAHSPVVRYLRDRVADLNGALDAATVVCRRCPARLTADGQVHRQSGGFSPDSGILLCANEVAGRTHLEDTLAHEMVHAYDHLRFKVDFRGDKDLKHAACTEIRASMLSGECRWTKESFGRGNWTLTQQFQECVRKRAIMSVQARPHCRDDVQATKVVNQVWDSCFADTRPFDEVYR